MQRCRTVSQASRDAARAAKQAAQAMEAAVLAGSDKAAHAGSLEPIPLPHHGHWFTAL